MLELFPMRLDAESVRTLEEISQKAGIAPSALVRNCVKVVLKPETSLVEQVIQRAKKERNEELFGKGEKVKQVGANEGT